MGKVEIFVRPTIDADADALAPRIRAADRIECLSAALSPSRDSLMQGIEISEFCWTGFAGGEIAFIGGVTHAAFYSQRRVPWLLGSDAIDRHPAAFMRHCARWMPQVRQRFPVLENYADARNVKTLRWLKRLGFAMDEPAPYGALGRPFVRFSLGMEAGNCASQLPLH